MKGLTEKEGGRFRVGEAFFAEGEWIDAGLLRRQYGSSMAVYCIRSGDRARMHFVKSGQGVADLYCAQGVFTDACGKGTVIEMVDGAGHTVRVVPTNYCDYGNLFFADDLFRAGIFAEEIEGMRQKGAT